MAEVEVQFVEDIVKSLVDNPDAVRLSRTLDMKGVLLDLEVDPQDLGKVIGKKGMTINAIRSLLRVLGVKHDARFSLKVNDGNEHQPYVARDNSNDESSSYTVDSSINEDVSSGDSAVEEQSAHIDQSLENLKNKAKADLGDLDDDF
jgi:predicted RNA-binding protein YlqC (UPF0109 family)